jgi:hypothetical protein
MRSATIMASAAVLLLAGCNANASDDSRGQKIRRDYQVGAFDKIASAGSQDVVFTTGATPSVRAEGDSKYIDKLEVAVDGGTLRIGPKEHKGFSFGFSHHGPVTVYVTGPSLTGAEVAGSGDFKVDKVTGGDFNGSIAGSGNMQVGSVQARSATFSIAGSGNVQASGRVEAAQYSIAGSGNVRAGGLEARRAKVEVAGSGNVEARAMETADISVMGSGDVVVTGTARCNIDKAGSGDARCGG